MPLIDIGKIGNLVMPAIRGAAKNNRLVRQAVDTVTDPFTYRRLANEAESVLGRKLPEAFRGTGFSNIPARATGLISDISEIPQGLQRAVQSGMVGRQLNSMAGIPTPGGRFALPNNPIRTISTNAPAALQDLGDPFQRDYGLTRELMRRGGGNLSRVAEQLVPKNISSQVAEGAQSFGNMLMKESSLAKGLTSKIPLPGLIKSTILPTSVAGSIFGLLSLEGSTPQAETKYDRWQQLGYPSKEAMKNRVEEQEGKARPVGSTSRLGGKPVRWTGTGWQETNLEGGSPLTPVVNPPAYPGSDQELPITSLVNDGARIPTPTPRYSMAPDVDRAYKAELYRQQQLAAQDPNPVIPQAQGYLPVASQEEQDRRMLAWAQAHGDLAALVREGQSGFNVIDQARDY